MNDLDFTEHPHNRLNILTGDWILVSPQRMKRPWQGKVETPPPLERPKYDPKCYLCPGNTRADGSVNPKYTSCFSFTNDYAALIPDVPNGKFNTDDLLVAHGENGTCRVICFSPRHDLTLPELSIEEINDVVELWCEEFASLSKNASIKSIIIFENKGEIMGCSNPHPHGQIWAQHDLPVEMVKETEQQQKYFTKHNKSLLSDYLELELKKKERLVLENEQFVVLVPFWAVWPYELIIISRISIPTILQFSEEER